MSTTSATTGNGGNKTNWDERELGCLWRREKPSTKEKYLTGVINLKPLGFDKDVQVIVFTNKNKQKDTHPDLRVYISEKRPAAKGTTAAPAKAPAATAPAAPAPDANELI
jgi:hypothetical protein